MPIKKPSMALTLLLSFFAAPHAVADENSEIEKIEVYSKYKKRVGTTGLDLNIGETPQAISIVDDEMMGLYHMESIRDVLDSVTGIYGENLPTSNSRFYYSRGFVINNYLVDGNESVSTHLQMSTLDTAMFDSVQVIRGATGMLQQMGQPSGSVNLIRKRASAHATETYLSAEVGSWDKRRFELDTNVALTENLAVRAVIVDSAQDYFIDDQQSDRSAYYATLNYQITPNLTVNLFHSQQEDDLTGTSAGLPYAYTDGTLFEGDKSLNIAPAWSGSNDKVTMSTAEINYSITDNWSVIARYDDSKFESDGILPINLSFLSSEDNSLVYLPINSTRDNSANQFELNVLGEFELLSATHDVSITYTDGEKNELYTRYQGSPATVVMLDIFEPSSRNIPAPSYSDTGTPYADLVKSRVLRTAVNWNLTEQLNVITAYAKKDFDVSEPGNSASQAYSFSDGNKYIGVVYDFNDQYSAYASFTDVFNFGGQRDINAELLGPSFGENKEIGLRSSFINNALAVDFNIFQIDMNNVPTWTDQSLVYKAVKGMTSEGYELEVSGYITDDLSIMASYTNFNVSDAEGEIVAELVADEMFKINANYQLSNDLNLAVSVNRTGEHQGYLRDSNNAFYFVPLDAYTLVNLTATYNVTDALTVQANIENATDEEYYSKVSGYTKRYGEPRNYSLRVMYNF